MNLYAIGGLISGITVLSFAFLVLYKSENKPMGRIWFLFSLSACIWCFSLFSLNFTTNESTGLLIWQLSYIFGVNWIPILFYHFICLFCCLKRTLIIRLQYLIGLALTYISFKPIFFMSINWGYDSIFHPAAGSFFYIYICWWVSLVVLSHLELIWSYKSASDQKKNQIKYFFIATAIGYGGGSIDFLPMFGIPVYFYGTFFIFVFPFIMSYAILKYRLMDVNVFVKRAFLAIGVYLFLLLFATPFLVALHSSSKQLLIVEVILTSLLLSAGPFIYAFVVQRASYFKEKSIVGLTHELKSPLANISNALEHMTDGNRAEYQEIIKKNTERLSSYIEDLLSSYRNTKNQTELILTRTDVNHLCQDAISQHQPIAKKKGTQIMFRPINNDNSFICDSEKIQQVFSNLISNAVKFTEKGKIKITGEKKEGQIEFRVQDNGKGIIPAEQSKIFNRFYQGKNNDTRKGSGIGLTIAKTWIEAHGGRIWAESEGEGRGTAVVFTLPMKAYL